MVLMKVEGLSIKIGRYWFRVIFDYFYFITLLCKVYLLSLKTYYFKSIKKKNIFLQMSS